MGMPPLHLQANKPSGVPSGPKRELILKHISAVMILDINLHHFLKNFKVGFDIKLLLGFSTWRRARQPIPVLLPGESHGQRSLVGYSPQGHKESDMTEQLSMHVCISFQI